MGFEQDRGDGGVANGRPVNRLDTEAALARTALRVVAIGLAGLTLANCAGSHVAGGKRNKYGVAPSPRVIAEGEPVPKGGGRAMVGKPYVVGDRTYVPHAGKGYDREGWASWYGTAFHGRLTANGEVFDRQSIAAAHPTLPLPSYVRITNAANGRSMIVRVNDRGPYEKSRLIDVSERVAEALEFRRQGVSRVRVQYVGKASLHGSDDDKLMATLRDDGSLAPSGNLRAPVMVAAREDDDKPATAVKVADARPRLGNLPEYEEPRRPSAARSVPPASRDEARAAVPVRGPMAPPERPHARMAASDEGSSRGEGRLNIKPPAKPDFTGIY